MKKNLQTAAFFLLLASSQIIAQETPKLGKNSIKEVVAAMTLDEKINLLKGIGMKVATGEDGPVAGIIDGKVKGAAGSTEAIERLGIPGVIVADGPAGLRIEPVQVGNKLNYTTAFPVGTATTKAPVPSTFPTLSGSAGLAAKSKPLARFKLRL